MRSMFCDLGLAMSAQLTTNFTCHKCVSGSDHRASVVPKKGPLHEKLQNASVPVLIDELSIRIVL